MPEMSGTELLENIQLAHPNAIRIIVITHSDRSTLLETVAGSLIHDMVIRPWKGDEVRFTIQRWSEEYRKTIRLERQTEQGIVFQRQLQESNTLIEELIQELRVASVATAHRETWYEKLLGKKRSPGG
jgi:response regulator RpfG family c-di-GMP phosphodiesterase